ncbi:somatostatin receptor type 5-like [Saccoglossus kowalevskii]|uniref:Somatostatin receptor type 5-like n=1 Tax=Saccoglossus kowalevskii TaxID=10224 RepID=A0ABM0MU61_SACKO|nr:PREDICTED: somatostatin receptor type 5-like [Saccoglossus kowalevskii]
METNSTELNTSFLCENNVVCGTQSQLPGCILDSDSQFIAGLIICTVGIFGNSAFMFVVLRIPYMRTAINAFLVNLAIADLLHLVGHWFTWICALLEVKQCPMKTSMPLICMDLFMSKVTQYVSLFTVTVLSIDRYMALCKPLMYRDGILHKRKRVALVIITVWSLGVLLSLEWLVSCLNFNPLLYALPELI